MATATGALALGNINAYYGDSHVLHGVSFALGHARLLGLLGRNGAGKTTCLNVAVGLLPPRRGTVAVNGNDVTGRSPETIAARGVALVPQGRRIFKSLTVRENLLVAARLPAAATQVSAMDVRARLRDVSAALRAAESGRGLSFRRRAADAGDRPCADVEPARAADG